MHVTTKDWFDDAEYDMGSAEAMLKSGRWFFVVFMCHLAIEKALKVLWVEFKRDVPPKSHQLVFLSGEVVSDIMPDHLNTLLDYLDDKGVLTRYPDGRKELAKELDMKKVEEIFNASKELVEWLKDRTK